MTPTAPAPQPPGEIAASTEFGRYVLHQLIAEGGMAEIFLADQQAPGGVTKRVALKRMLAHLCGRESFVAMFLDEAKLSARLEHPNVVQIYDFGEIDGLYYLAMEYLAGEDVAAIRNHFAELKTPVPLWAAIQIFIAACDGLHYAHELTDGDRPLNLVHRDVSPSNIMVTYQGHVKVLDFGIARAIDRQQEKTATGVFKGTLMYASPEHLQGKPVDRRSDQFSLAAVLYELLSGQRLFRRSTEFETYNAVVNEPTPPLTQFRPDSPPALDAILSRALKKDPNDRYPTLRDLRLDLEALNLASELRLDEFMLATFGESRRARRMNPRTSVSQGSGTASRTATAIGPKTARFLSGAADTQPVVVDFAMGRTTTGVRLKPLDAPVAEPQAQPPTADAPPTRRSRWPLALGAVVAAAVLSVVASRVPRKAPDVPAPPPVVSAPLPTSAPEPPRAALAPAKLEVDAPEAARIWIDGAERGGPGVHDVAPGAHEVKVVMAGHEPSRTTVRLAAGEAVRVKAVFPAKRAAPVATGALDVSCVPWCRVFVDGRDIGKPSPVVGLKLPVGRHTLRLEHPPSGRSKDTVILILKDSTVRESASFR